MEVLQEKVGKIVHDKDDIDLPIHGSVRWTRTHRPLQVLWNPQCHLRHDALRTWSTYALPYRFRFILHLLGD